MKTNVLLSLDLEPSEQLNLTDTFAHVTDALEAAEFDVLDISLAPLPFLQPPPALATTGAVENENTKT